MFKRWLILIFIPFLIEAQNYPSAPVNYITDETGTLTQEQQNDLNRKLRNFEDSTSNQIFVYLAASLNGSDLEQLSEEIFHNWRIGQKNKNNGVLISIFIADHKFRIQTGYGLEGQLPDLLTKRIQDNDMRPFFKQKDYYGGINSGIDKLIYYSKNQFSPSEITSQPTEANKDWLLSYIPNTILFLILLVGLKKDVRVKRSRTRKAWQTIIGLIFALIPCIGGILMFFQLGFLFGKRGSRTYSSGGSSSDSSWSSSSDSSWSSSSSSDFGGGGGGDSGGGGSSSDW